MESLAFRSGIPQRSVFSNLAVAPQPVCGDSSATEVRIIACGQNNQLYTFGIIAVGETQNRPIVVTRLARAESVKLRAIFSGRSCPKLLYAPVAQLACGVGGYFQGLSEQEDYRAALARGAFPMLVWRPALRSQALSPVGLPPPLSSASCF